jgi:hypothetical protein
MQRIAVRQKECKYLFLINYFAPAIPKEPKFLFNEKSIWLFLQKQWWFACKDFPDRAPTR